MLVNLGRGPSFTQTNDIILVHKVATVRVHIAPFGEVLKIFSTTVDRANANPNLSTKATSKRKKDLYKKWMKTFEKRDRTEEMMSGVGGEVLGAARSVE